MISHGRTRSGITKVPQGLKLHGIYINLSIMNEGALAKTSPPYLEGYFIPSRFCYIKLGSLMLLLKTSRLKFEDVNFRSLQNTFSPTEWMRLSRHHKTLTGYMFIAPISGEVKTLISM